MITVVSISNPLDPFGSQSVCQMMAGLPLESYISAMLPNIPDHYELVVSVDGRPVERDTCPIILDKQSVAFVVVPEGGSGGGGAGKMVLRIVGAIVIAVASVYSGGAAAGAFGYVAGSGAAMTAAQGAAYIGAAAAVSIAGSMIMSAILPIQAAQQTGGNQSSPTYSWNVQSNAVAEGNALPLLFGTMRVFPPRLSIYTEMNGQAQTIGLLFAVAGHAIDEITDIEINEVGDIATNYPEARTQTQYGLNNNVVMQGFDNTTTIISADVGLPGNKLDLNWRTIVTQGNAFTQLAFGFVFYGGLYGMSEDDQGNYPVGVAIKMQISPHGLNDWVTMYEDNPDPVTISTPRWSGGYYGWYSSTDQNSVWYEIEEGSTDPDAHREGDIYSPPNDEWMTTNYGSDYRPLTQWHWLANLVEVIPPGDPLTALPYLSIRENSTSPLRFIKYTYRLAQGQWDFRVALYDSTSVSTSREIRDCYLEYYSEIIEDDFTYPNVSLLSLRSVATSKLANEIPRVSCVASRWNVYVHDGATWTTKLSSNPAWASYDALVGARYVVDINDASYDANDSDTWVWVIMETGPVDHARVIYADFLEWADWCDLDLTVGGTLPDLKSPYTCNLYLDTTTNLRKALDIIGLCGRGLAVQQGAMWTCVVEKPETLPVQRFIFNVANIEKDSFQESWLPMDDRANVLEMTYYPATNNYKAKSFEIYQTGYDASLEEPKRTTCDYRGCTNEAMAVKFGKFLLNCNRYLTLTASWTAFTDSIACFPGQIVEVQHDVPQNGYGGRTLTGSTTTVVLLDRAVPMVVDLVYHVVIYHQTDDLREEARVFPIVFPAGTVWRGTWVSGGTYAVGDGCYFTATTNYKTKTAAPDTWTVCADHGDTVILIIDETMTDPAVAHLARAPAVDSKFNYGDVEDEGTLDEAWRVSKLMRVLKITRASDQRRQLTCVEFVNTVFEDGATVNASSPSDLPRQMFPPALISADLELVWRLDPQEKKWVPWVRISFTHDPDIDYVNMPIPISKLRVYAHADTGDTHLLPMSVGTYDIVFDWVAGMAEYPASSLNDQTLYLTATLINIQGMEGSKCPPGVLYVTTAFTPAPSTSNVNIESYDYVSNGPNGYLAYISWVPYGWTTEIIMSLSNSAVLPYEAFTNVFKWVSASHTTGTGDSVCGSNPLGLTVGVVYKLEIWGAKTSGDYPYFLTCQYPYTNSLFWLGGNSVWAQMVAGYQSFTFTALSTDLYFNIYNASADPNSAWYAGYTLNAVTAPKYKPILTWNGGNNYYNFKSYSVVYGLVSAPAGIPALADMGVIETQDIGNIFAANGTMITDADDLDAICRGAAAAVLSLSYCAKYVACAVVPNVKNGASTILDITQADYGLDWEYIYQPVPGGPSGTVEENQITNAELVYTMQAGATFLNEMNWDWPSNVPIDGFAIMFRAQPNLWSWLLNLSWPDSSTSITTLLNRLDVNSGGGTVAATDFVARYTEWYAAGIPHFYMLMSDATNFEVMKIDTDKVNTAPGTAITRGVEGTTARTWASGSCWSYSPCELIDTWAPITDVTQRSFVFSPPIEVNFALHSTIVAVKIIPEAPRYKRCNYAYWDTVRLR